MPRKVISKKTPFYKSPWLWGPIAVITSLAVVVGSTELAAKHRHNVAVSKRDLKAGQEKMIGKLASANWSTIRVGQTVGHIVIDPKLSDLIDADFDYDSHSGTDKNTKNYGPKFLAHENYDAMLLKPSTCQDETINLNNSTAHYPELKVVASDPLARGSITASYDTLGSAASGHATLHVCDTSPTQGDITVINNPSDIHVDITDNNKYKAA
jgi:hypothetical protein